MISVYSDQQLNLRFFDRSLPAFYPKDPVTVVQVEIDPAMRKISPQKEDNTPGSLLILHISLEDLYDFHILRVNRY